MKPLDHVDALPGASVAVVAIADDDVADARDLHRDADAPLDATPSMTWSQAEFDRWMERRGPRCRTCGGTRTPLRPFSLCCSC